MDGSQILQWPLVRPICLRQVVSRLSRALVFIDIVTASAEQAFRYRIEWYDVERGRYLATSHFGVAQKVC